MAGRGLSQGPPGAPESRRHREPRLGWLAQDVQQELPELKLISAEVQVGRAEQVTASCPPDVKARLRGLSNRFHGARAIGIRREPVPAAYRVFFRQIGLDPDVVQTPIEAAVRERMLRGGFLPGGLLEDILLIALLDTGIPVWALASETVDGALGIRSSAEGERLGTSPDAAVLPPGRLVIADSSAPLAILFGELAAAHRPQARTRELTLFAVAVAGVPGLYVQEALWTCQTALSSPDDAAGARA
jgi:DNA/RNA-binding domain of Phe-tRNA-synthetase-like protein